MNLLKDNDFKIINKRKDLRTLGICFGIFFALSFLLFVISTFYDMQIMDYVTPSMDNIHVKRGAVFSDAIGNSLPPLAIFTALTICVESYFMHLKNIKNNLGVKRSFMERNKNIFIGGYYALFFLLLTLFSILFILSTYNYNQGFGIGQDVYAMGPISIRRTSIIIIVFIMYSYFLVTLFIFRFKFSKNLNLINNKYGEYALRIIIYSIISYLMVLTLKAFFGRPFYYSVVFEEQMKGRVEQMGGIKDPESGDGTGAEYHPGYKPNNILENFKNIFIGVDKSIPNDHGGDHDFPSGHVMAASIFCSSFGYLFVNKKTNKKTNILKIIAMITSLIIVGSMAAAVVIERFHGPTDVFGSSCFIVLFQLASKNICNKGKHVGINKFNSFLIKNDNKIIIEENDNKIIVKNFYDNEWVVVKKNKINKKFDITKFTKRMNKLYSIKER